MNRFIIADAQKCIGCRTCEVACVVSHQHDQSCTTVSAPQFAPRIRVVKSDELSTATLCRQCEDAPCANVCPVDAIQVKMPPGTLTSVAVSAVKAAWSPALMAQ